MAYCEKPLETGGRCYREPGHSGPCASRYCNTLIHVKAPNLKEVRCDRPPEHKGMCDADVLYEQKAAGVTPFFVQQADFKEMVEVAADAFANEQRMIVRRPLGAMPDCTNILTEAMANPGKTVVIYHANCNDGFAAAWVFDRLLRDSQKLGLGTGSATFVPAQHDDAPPDVTGKVVFVLDFSYPREILEQMRAEATNMLVLDHHRSTEKAMQGLGYCYFDMTKSGATLAWQCLWRDAAEAWVADGNLLEAAWVIDHVEDRDLWKKKLDGTEEIHSALSLLPRTFEAWDEAAFAGRAEMIKKGRVLLEQKRLDIQRTLQFATMAMLFGYKVPVINMLPFHVSEVLQEMAQGYPFAVAWFVTEKGDVKYSLRSAEDGMEVDVLAAGVPGGGGHPHAAGFSALGVVHTLVSGEKWIKGGRK